jgi:hypothetical protein
MVVGVVVFLNVGLSHYHKITLSQGVGGDVIDVTSVITKKCHPEEQSDVGIYLCERTTKDCHGCASQ